MENRFMKPLNILFLYLCLPIFGCTVSDRVDNQDFAFDTYYPTPNEIRLAEQRGQRYWQNNSHRFQNFNAVSGGVYYECPASGHNTRSICKVDKLRDGRQLFRSRGTMLN